jgi:hypothetical protein
MSADEGVPVRLPLAGEFPEAVTGIPLEKDFKKIFFGFVK